MRRNGEKRECRDAYRVCTSVGKESSMRTFVMLSRLGVLSLCLVGMTMQPAMAEEKPAGGRRTVTVSGEGEVTVSPDLAILAVAVETTAPKAADAVSQNAALSTKVANALKGLVGRDDKVTTTRYSLEPRYEPAKRNEPSEPRIIGYVAQNEVQVETHKIDGVGQLIDASSAAGANRVSGLQFTLANRSEPLRAALQKAGAEARAQAESVAGALGVKLKEVVSATTSAPPIIQPRYFERGMAAAAARPPTPIEPGTVSVSATLQVVYEIE
jgi:uncharacterized protein YggE